MITLTAGAVSIHKLVQAVILTAPGSTGDDGEQARDTALEWLDEVMPGKPSSDVAGWPLMRALIPQAGSIASRYAPGEEPASLDRVLSQVGTFHQMQGAYQDALRLRLNALDIAQRIYGDSHRETAIDMGNLAITYGALGRYADAMPLEERALAITETALGPDHPDTARCLGNLAATYLAIGRTADALPLEQRRQRIDQVPE